MKNIKVCILISSNIHAYEKRELTTEDLGYTESEWLKLTDEEKYHIAVEYWADNGNPEIWVEE